MSEYHVQEGAFTPPSGWIDATVNTLKYEGPEGPVILTIARSRRTKSLELAADALLVDLRRRLPRYALEDKRAIVFDGAPAIETRVHFHYDDGPAIRRAVDTLVGDRHVILSCIGPESQATAVDDLFDKVVSTLRRRHPAGGATA